MQSVFYFKFGWKDPQDPDIDEETRLIFTALNEGRHVERAMDIMRKIDLEKGNTKYANFIEDALIKHWSYFNTKDEVDRLTRLVNGKREIWEVTSNRFIDDNAEASHNIALCAKMVQDIKGDTTHEAVQLFNDNVAQMSDAEHNDPISYSKIFLEVAQKVPKYKPQNSAIKRNPYRR